MRWLLRFFAIGLLACGVATDAMAAVTVLPDEGCPAGTAVEANLERLGALSALARLGRAEIRVQGDALYVSFHDRGGASLGARTVAASPDCGARAALAATVIATFAGDWAQTRLAEPPAPARPAPAMGASLVARPPWQLELGTLGFGVHDGDAGTVGLGGRADLGRGLWMATAIVEGSWARERPLATGQGAYRFVRAGLGPGIRIQGDRLFWDVAVLAMAESLRLEARNLRGGLTASDWDFVAAVTTRLGWKGRRLRPFVFLGASYSIPQQNMVFTSSRVDRVGLSTANVEAGLGISLAFLP